MKKLIRQFFSTLFDITFWKYAIVGCVNTAVGASIMFLLYNVFHVGYWLSAACNHLAGSTTGYFLNKHFTFQNKDKGWKPVLKYIVNIASCYLVSYGIARPLMRLFLSGAEKSIQENIAMGATFSSTFALPPPILTLSFIISDRIEYIAAPTIPMSTVTSILPVPGSMYKRIVGFLSVVFLDQGSVRASSKRLVRLFRTLHYLLK